MSDTPKKSKLGDRIRATAAELRGQLNQDIKTYSRLAGAAAQLAENNDRLIDEAVEAAEDALDD